MKAKELVINIPATDNYIHFFFVLHEIKTTGRQIWMKLSRRKSLLMMLCVLDGIVVLLLTISYEFKVTDMRYIDST